MTLKQVRHSKFVLKFLKTSSTSRVYMNHREKDKRFCTGDILLRLECNSSIQRKQIVQQNLSYWLNKINSVFLLLDNLSLHKILKASFSFLRPLWSVISKFIVLCKSRCTQICVNGTESKPLWPDFDYRVNDLVPQGYLPLEQRFSPITGPRCPVGSRKLRFPDYVTMAQDVGKVVSLTHRPILPPGNTPGTHFC